MFSLAWHYLTGRAVATDPTNRQAAEWPPHPDRVFQALVAAWGETGESTAGKAALLWLEQQGLPHLAAPSPDELPDCPTINTFVPVNDVNGPKRGEYGDKLMSLIPSHRDRKDRGFPATLVGDTICALIWPEASPGVDISAALAKIAATITNIGHSRSLVRMWVCDAPPSPTWKPAGGTVRRELSLRVPDSGRLETLIRAYAGGGKGWQRPPVARWQSYIRIVKPTDMPAGVFDGRLLVLRQVSSQPLGLLQTLAFTDALRKTLIPLSESHGDVARSLISGHATNGAALETPHVAYFPLAHVGHAHADGHLLGFALALPRSLTPDAENAVFATLAKAMNAESATLRLVAGAAGACELALEERPAPPQALRSIFWCRPSSCWGTVTPIVLDRLPPRRHTNIDAWAAEQIAAACEKQGLPAPVAIHVMPVSPHLGAPTAREFQPLPQRGDGGRRWHIHARLEFGGAVCGPLLLGAGRYRGYGLCKPLSLEMTP